MKRKGLSVFLFLLGVALAAHSGRPEVLTAWMDPSITDETDVLSVDELVARTSAEYEAASARVKLG